MPTSTQSPETHIEDRPNVEDDVPATSSTKASPGHKATETTQTVVEAASSRKEENTLPGPGLRVPHPPIKSVECNMMSYNDDGGVTCQIYMPKGTMRLACALSMAKRFSDLAKFPAWGE